MKVCGVVVLYYPEKEEAIHNIQRYLPHIDHLIIWDNTPKEDQSQSKLNFSDDSAKITYLSSGKNEGIASALNNASKWASEHGYTHLLTMDQDSEWENFKLYREEIEKNFTDNIAAYAPIIQDTARNIKGFNSEEQIITSGAIYNLRILDELGGFCEEFMIDNVDTEYSFRIRLSQFGIKIIPNAILKQSFGNIKKVPVLGCYHGNYSPFRLYHILRNNLWMWRMYKNTDILPKRFLSYNTLFTYLVREPALILLQSKNKTSKISSLIKGFIDGMAKYPKTLDNYLKKV